MSAHEHADGPGAIADHLRAAGADAAIVVDGSAAEVIARLLADGWTWDDHPAERVAGKRIRYLRPPA